MTGASAVGTERVHETDRLHATGEVVTTMAIVEIVASQDVLTGEMITKPCQKFIECTRHA